MVKYLSIVTLFLAIAVLEMYGAPIDSTIMMKRTPQTGATTPQSNGNVAQGSVIQVPVHIPVNVCGNSTPAIGVLNPAFGVDCPLN